MHAQAGYIQNGVQTASIDEKSSTGAATANAAINNGPANADAYTYADVGVLKVRTSINVSGVANFDIYGTASASWQQTIQFINPELTGTQGTALLKQYYWSQSSIAADNGLTFSYATNNVYFRDVDYSADNGGYNVAESSFTSLSGVFTAGAPSETFGLGQGADFQHGLADKPYDAPAN